MRRMTPPATAARFFMSRLMASRPRLRGLALLGSVSVLSCRVGITPFSLRVADPRIQECVADVYQQVHKDDQDREDECRGHNDRVVAVPDALDIVPPNAR